MAFTRFHDDPCRIEKQMQQMTGIGRYMINMPGNGDKPAVSDDPFIRMQKWGGNLMTNTINVESDLRGLSRPNTKDCITKNEYKSYAAKTSQVQYPSLAPTTDQTRATHPAWLYRDLEQVDWYYLPLNPQENTCMTFENNINTRIAARDSYVAQAPCLESAHF